MWPLRVCSWQAMGIPTGLLASLVACKNGVRRAHLVDARTDGGLILELYSRDGVGTMISSDFYEVRCLQPSLGWRRLTQWLRIWFSSYHVAG